MPQSMLTLVHLFPSIIIIEYFSMEEKKIAEDCSLTALHSLTVDIQQSEVWNFKGRALEHAQLMHSPFIDWNLLKRSLEFVVVWV